MIRWEFKFVITELHLIFVLIFGVHLSLLPMKSSHSDYIAELKREQEKKLNEQKKKMNGKTEEEILAALSAEKFLRRPFVITYLGNVKRKQYSELLSLLETKTSRSGPVISSAKSLVGMTKTSEIQAISDTTIDFKITDAQKKNIIKRLIKEKLSGVEVCKRKYLLEDEFLMGTIKVNMRIKGRDNLAVPKFQGHGKVKVIESLENCVRGELASMSFPRELADEEVTFDLRIN